MNQRMVKVDTLHPGLVPLYQELDALFVWLIIFVMFFYIDNIYYGYMEPGNPNKNFVNSPWHN